MNTKHEELIKFTDKHIKSTWLTHCDEIYLKSQTLVINLGEKSTTILAAPDKLLTPRTSALLKDVTLKGGDSLLLIEITDELNIGGVVLDPQWHPLGEICDFPKDVPLWKSPQFDLGIVKFDPYFVTGLSTVNDKSKIKSYQLKVNLWFVPAKTNCGIHNHHATPEFLEVHTQIYGDGRMQKFHSNDFTTLYQDVRMSPGMTHIPFASVDSEGGFFYPWHQYYSDTDCIWIANEFHPIA